MFRRDLFKFIGAGIAVAVGIKPEVPKWPGPPVYLRYNKNKWQSDLYISPEAMEDIRNWNVDQIDEKTRKEIMPTNSGVEKLASILGQNSEKGTLSIA